MVNAQESTKQKAIPVNCDVRTQNNANTANTGLSLLTFSGMMAKHRYHN